jgi:hypothetical protein
MSFNTSKPKVMHAGQRNPGHEYTMSRRKLAATNEERDIGIIVCSSLRPSAQCSKAAGMATNEERDIGITVSGSLRPSAQCCKAAGTVTAVPGQISRAFHYRDRHTFVGLYKQYVRPHVQFAVQAWSPWTLQDREVPEKVQKRAVGMVSGLKGRTYEEKLEELGLTTLEERRHQADMAQVYKIVTG